MIDESYLWRTHHRSYNQMMLVHLSFPLRLHQPVQTRSLYKYHPVIMSVVASLRVKVSRIDLPYAYHGPAVKSLRLKVGMR